MIKGNKALARKEWCESPNEQMKNLRGFEASRLITFFILTFTLPIFMSQFYKVIDSVTLSKKEIELIYDCGHVFTRPEGVNQVGNCSEILKKA